MNKNLLALTAGPMLASLIADGILVPVKHDDSATAPASPPPPPPCGIVLAADLDTYPLSAPAVEKLTRKTARTIHDVDRMVKAEEKRRRKELKLAAEGPLTRETTNRASARKER